MTVNSESNSNLNNGEVSHWIRSVWDGYNFDEDLSRTPYMDITHIHDSYISEYASGKKNADIRIIDAGCGMGRLLRYYHGKGYNIVGVELLKDIVKKVCDTFPYLNIKNSTVTQLPFQESEFDVYISVGVLRWIPSSERLKLFTEAARVLKPGGLLFVDSHLDTLFYRTLDKLKHALGKKDNAIELRVAFKEIRQLCANSGFQVVVLRADIPNYFSPWVARIPVLQKVCLDSTGNLIVPHKFKPFIERELRFLMNFFGINSGNFYLVAKKIEHSCSGCYF